ncbi:MAG TPA: hypothetical protein VFI61_01490 [Patescibacteria group bacterium]|nr:hypothetical protein [Patescibacteria group bacterium]
MINEKRNFFFNPFIIFVVISTILTLIWFKDGSILGGGEVGAPFYNLTRMYEMSNMAWSDRGLGKSTGFSVGGAAYYAFFNFFQNIGVQGYILQASFFFICLLLTLISSYLLMREVLPKLGKASYLYASLFYLVNPYSLVNIWNRFLPNQIIFYAFLPLGIWLFIYGLRTKKYYFAILNMILTAVFSVAFIGPAQTLIFWGLMFLVGLYYFIFEKKDKFVFLYFILNVLLWLIFNSFWVIQQISFRFSQTYTTVSNLFFTSVGNFETFNSLSRQLGKLSNLFLLQHGPFFEDTFGFQYNWPAVYNHPIFLICQWAFIIYVLSIAIKNIKSYWINFFFLVFLIGIFISKGNSQPLGEVVDFLFKRISFLEFFRNPFEKAGVLIAFGLTPLVGLGYSKISQYANSLRRSAKLFILYIPWVYITILGFPFWTGFVFTNGYSPSNNINIGYQVVPPDYYLSADNYLSEQPGLFRFMSLPIGGEGIYNNWLKGYVGVEQSGVLFSTPSLSYDTTIPLYSGVVSKIEELFIRYPDFYRLAGMLNLKYLVFRSDFDYVRSGMRDPNVIEQLLAKRILDPNSKISFDSNFLPLKIFKFAQDITLPKIYAANKNINSDLAGSLEDALIVQNEPRDVISNYNNPNLDDRTYANISHSQTFFNLGEKYPTYSEDYYIFPYVSVLPSSYKYKLVLIKEKLQRILMLNNTDRVSFDILLLGKRLKEAELSLSTNDFKSAHISLDGYNSTMPQVVKEISQMSGLKQPDERTWKEGEMFTIFSSHIFLLNKFETNEINKDGYVSKIKSNLVEETSLAKILPRFSPIGDNNFSTSNRLVYQWKTDKEGIYEMLIPKTTLFPSKFNIPKMLEIQLDDHIKSVYVQDTKEGISLGVQILTKGLHEIQIVSPASSNMLSDNFGYSLDVSSGSTEQKLLFPKFDPYSQYVINFDYKIFYGAGLNFAIKANTDQVDRKTNEQRYSFSKGLSSDGYWYDNKHFSGIFKPSSKSDSAEVIFSTSVWNNCNEVYLNISKKCLDPETRKKFDRPTKIEIKDINISPLIPQQLFLISKNDTNKKVEIPEIEFNRLNFTKYRVTVKGAKSPYLLVLSDLYDSGWAVYSDNIELDTKNHFLVNGYANAWWIDKNGDYNLDIVYKPQQVLSIGYKISFIAISLSSVFLILVTIKNYLKRFKNKI